MPLSHHDVRLRQGVARSARPTAHPAGELHMPALTVNAQRVPRLRAMLLSEKRGAWGALYKAAVIGTRLHWQVSVACCLMAFVILFKSR